MKKSNRTSKKSTKQQMSVVQISRIFLAGYLLMMLLSQLFAFEKMPGLIGESGIPIVWSGVLAVALAVFELISIPFLIGMRLPERLLIIGKLAVIFSLILLICLEVASFMAGSTMIFGAAFDLPGGSWSLLFISAITILAIWAVFGDNFSKKTKKPKKVAKSRK